MIKKSSFYGNVKAYFFLIYFIFYSKICLSDFYGVNEDYSYYQKFPFGEIIFCVAMVVAYGIFPHITIPCLLFWVGLLLISKGGVGIAFGLVPTVIGLYFVYDLFIKDRIVSGKFNNEKKKLSPSHPVSISEKTQTGDKNEIKPIVPQPTNVNDAPDPARLRAARMALGKSQSSVAQILGVTHAAYNRWETGLATPVPERREKLWKLIQLAERQGSGEPE
jgi:DNA-binding XRE family transcriptional regulator